MALRSSCDKAHHAALFLRGIIAAARAAGVTYCIEPLSPDQTPLVNTVAEAAAIVRAVVQLARALDMKVIAEGVETAAQRDLLLSLGCDEGQGYFIGKPMPQDDFIAWARGWEPPEGVTQTAESVLAKLG